MIGSTPIGLSVACGMGASGEDVVDHDSRLESLIVCRRDATSASGQEERMLKGMVAVFLASTSASVAFGRAGFSEP